MGIPDADGRLGGNRRLGMQGDADAGQPQHVEVVGAVADGNGVFG